jgi:hypothetical protein
MSSGVPTRARRVLFSATERRQLLAAPRVGPGLVARLEQIGVASFEALCQRGVDDVIAEVCRAVGNQASLNRRRALIRALESFGQVNGGDAA